MTRSAGDRPVRARRRSLWAAFAAVGVVSLMLPAGPGAAAGRPAAPQFPGVLAPAALRLVAQDHLSVPPDGTVTITVGAPAGLDLTAFDVPAATAPTTNPPATEAPPATAGAPDATIATAPAAPATPPAPPAPPAPVADVLVSVYPRVVTRAAAQLSTTAPPGKPVSTVTLTAGQVSRPAPGQLTVPVVTNSVKPVDGVLWLPASGLYPVTIETRLGGATTGRVVTFIQREPGVGEVQPAAMAVALAVGTDVPVVLDTTGKVHFDAATLAELTTLVEILETSRMPATVHVAPQLLAGLRQADPALADRYAAVLAKATIISAPVLPLDPSSAAAAGQGQLYSDWLAAGEDLFGSADLPGTTLRAAVAVTAPLDEAGGELLRGLGTRLLLLPADTYDTLDGNIGGYTTTQLVRVRLDDARSFDAAVVDRGLAEDLAGPSAQPFANAVYATADLLAARQEIISAGGDPRRHTVLLATERIGLPDPVTLAPITSLVASTPELAVSSIGQLSASTDVQTVDGRDVTVHLPANVGAEDLGPRLAVQAELRAATTQTASMLVDGDPRPAQWQAQLDLLPSTALDAQGAATITGSVRSQLASIRSSVQPPSGLDFTLTGRTGVVRLKFYNSASTPLKIRIRLDAAAGKLTFADEQEKVLAPAMTTEVEVSIRARANGRFPVYLTVLAPADLAGRNPIAQSRLTATVLGLTGLGNLVTGAALLVLLTWWVRHIRLNRRRRAEAATLERHPVSAGEPPYGDHPSLDESGLSPDAAASTLDES